MANLFSAWLASYCLLLQLLAGHVYALLPRSTNFVPLTSYVAGQLFTLNASSTIATFDYGREAAGHPLFFIANTYGDVENEVKYSEQFSGLPAPFSDGPFPFVTGLSNTYHVETLEITQPDGIKNFLIHLASAVGLNATISTDTVNPLPGSFSSSSSLLNNIWSLGARTVGTTCAAQGLQTAIWEVGSNGTFIRGLRPGVSADVRAAELRDYTLQFDVNLQRNGMGWKVAMPLHFPNTGIQLSIVGSLPAATTFVNTNNNLTPANMITLSYGYFLVNRTTLPSYLLQTFPFPSPLQEQKWYTITTVLTGGNYLAFLVQNQMVFNVSLSQYYIGGSRIYTAGSFGFGGWQDQSSFVKNVLVHSTASGALLYINSMTSASLVLPEYGTRENVRSVCLDGTKRDRLVWLGDFYHTSQIIAASTSRYDLVKGTLDFFYDWETSAGLIPINVPVGYDPTIAKSAFTLGGGGI